MPTGTSSDIIERLHRELAAALAEPRIRGRLVELTAIPIPGTAAEFRAEMAATTEKWGKVIRAANNAPMLRRVMPIRVPNKKPSAAPSSPSPPEKCDGDDQDPRGGKQEVSPRLPLAPRRLSKKMMRMLSRHGSPTPRAKARFSQHPSCLAHSNMTPSE